MWNLVGINIYTCISHFSSHKSHFQYITVNFICTNFWLWMNNKFTRWFTEPHSRLCYLSLERPSAALHEGQRSVVHGSLWVRRYRGCCWWWRSVKSPWPEKKHCKIHLAFSFDLLCEIPFGVLLIIILAMRHDF